MACSSEHTDSATHCQAARTVSDWIVPYSSGNCITMILLVKTKLQATERAYSFEQLPAWVNRTWTIVLIQVIDLSATATTIKGKLCTLLWAYVFPILAQCVL